ncbi:DUF4998 domain-containing protein [Pedobacter immunditicola]|uniref:DUF4998 domain-containing protein n=1 Tax=Pedobacter immunditicola TaxID=3133440 RepID=UPI0030B1F6B9
MKKNILLLLLISVVATLACTKMDDYKKYTNGKELAYAGKADSLRAFPGKNRIKLSWRLVSDPKITKARIYWNNKADSLEIAIKRTVGVDTINVILEKMKEGNYSFEVITIHDDQIRSVPAYISGRVYGQNYEVTLLNRGIQSTTYLTNNGYRINWGLVEGTALGVDITYAKTNGTVTNYRVPTTENVTTLTTVKRPGQIYYRTLFKPDSLSIDTFYSKIDTLRLN